MYKSYQLQLVLVHAQALFAGYLSYADLVMNISFVSLQSATFGIESINYFYVIPWYFVIQFYVFLIPKAVSMLKFHCNYFIMASR